MSVYTPRRQTHAQKYVTFMKNHLSHQWFETMHFQVLLSQAHLADFWKDKKTSFFSSKLSLPHRNWSRPKSAVYVDFCPVNWLKSRLLNIISLSWPVRSKTLRKFFMNQQKFKSVPQNPEKLCEFHRDRLIQNERKWSSFRSGVFVSVRCKLFARHSAANYRIPLTCRRLQPTTFCPLFKALWAVCAFGRTFGRAILHINPIAMRRTIHTGSMLCAENCTQKSTVLRLPKT